MIDFCNVATNMGCCGSTSKQHCTKQASDSTNYKVLEMRNTNEIFQVEQHVIKFVDRAEFKIMTKLTKHPNPNVIELVERHSATEMQLIREHGHKRNFIVMKYGGIDLQELICGGHKFTQIKHLVIQQMLKAVLHIHSIDIVHGDISLENFTWSPEDGIKLIDFGCAFDYASRTSGVFSFAKESYSAPELEHFTRFGRHDAFKLDVYSLGICIFGLVTGHMIYSEIGDRMYNYIKNKGLKTYCEKTSIDLGKYITLIEKMIHHDPSTRCTIQEACKMFDQAL